MWKNAQVKVKPDYLEIPKLTAIKESVLSTNGCLIIAERLNQFENSKYGSDFICPLVRLAHWIRSGDLLYSAVITRSSANDFKVLSVASILIVDIESIDAIIHGHIHESELKPFSLARPGAVPAFYFSSLAVQHPTHAIALFRSITSDFQNKYKNCNLQADTAFSIPSGVDGSTYLVKSGFKPISGKVYLNKYPIYMLSNSTVQSRFWKQLLSNKVTQSERAQALNYSFLENGNKVSGLELCMIDF